MTRFAIAALAGVSLMIAAAPARSEPNYLMWRIAHDRLVAKWLQKPRCGWTVGGYSCSSGRRAHHAARRAATD